jgi:lipoprotein-releasing system ATP-binding protein
MPDLIVRDLTKQFATRAAPLVVLTGIDLDLSSGESLAILGPSGCGKSTLLHILGTLDRPTLGSVELLGEDPFELEEPQLAAFRNRRIGFVFQDHHLLPQCNVLENVLLPAIAQGRAAPAYLAGRGPPPHAASARRKVPRADALAGRPVPRGPAASARVQ